MADVWDSLPGMVRETVERHLGPTSSVTPVPGGQNNDLAAVAHGTAGPVFVKAVRGISPRMRWLRNEITAGALASGIAPAVIFAEDVAADDHWLIVGSEYLPGRPADLAPGSADLPVVGSTVDRISSLPAPGLRSLRDRWAGCSWWEQLAETDPAAVACWDVPAAERWAAQAPDAVAGDRLVHTDLHADQFLIGPDGTVRVVDWGWPAVGAGWIDAAFMVIRLVASGHSPQAAEAWAAERACWDVDNAAHTAFAVYVAGLWSYRAATVPGWGSRRARIARGYAAWRMCVPVPAEAPTTRARLGAGPCGQREQRA